MNELWIWTTASMAHFYLLHGCLSLLFAIVGGLILKRRYADAHYKIVALLLAMQIAMPIIGYLFGAWIIYYLRNVRYDKRLTHTRYIDMDDFQSEFVQIKRIFGEASISELLNGTNSSSALKTKALASVSDHINQKNINLIKRSLSDSDDEVRLYSFALIDGMERDINDKIHQMLQAFEQTQALERKIDIARDLASLYWDMVYFELSDADLKSYILDQVKYFARFVLKVFPGDVKVNTILGKVYLIEHQYDEAATCFTLVIEQEGDNEYILPYLAEIYFNMRNFRSVKALLATADSMKINAMLHPVLQQWSHA